MFLGAVYLPRATSHVAWTAQQSVEDALQGLQADIAAYSRLGKVCLLGDFNAHTADLDDRGTECDGILDDMGGMGAVRSRLIAIPARANSDRSDACAVGRQLVALCAASQCVLLNGRSPGDQDGQATFVRGATSSVIDYGIVSRSLFPCVQTFAVEDSNGLSDHKPLVMVLSMPEAATPPPAERLAPLAVRWDPAKRDEYRLLLSGESYSRRRANVMHAFREGAMSLTEASATWVNIVLDAARSVFGVGHRARRLYGGRQAKRWFKACQPEYQAVRAAVARGDTAAAQEARRVFNCKKRREQRRLAAQAQAEHLRDIKHNPRRFWTGYKKGPSQPSFHDMDALTEHWPSLYGVPGCGGLPETAPSVESLLHQLQGERGEAPVDELSAEISVAEVEAAVRKLRYGRAVGPDGLRGEFFKGLYARQEFWCAEQQRFLVNHVYDTQPGSVLGDLCELLNGAFGGGVPAGWCAAFLSAVFKKGDPAVLDNYRGIAVGACMGQGV